MRFSWHQKISDMVLQASQNQNPANIWSGWGTTAVLSLSSFLSLAPYKSIHFSDFKQYYIHHSTKAKFTYKHIY
jgi:hypothetical protein